MRKKDARDVAVSAITAFRKRDAWSDGFLRNEIRANKLSPRDAALATEIVNGVLQNMLLINNYIAEFSSIKFNKISPGILDILQAAVYQILFLDKIPDSAAVNDAVGRAKRNNPRAAGFVNALTRKISVEKGNLPEIRGSYADVLSVKYSHPVWLVKELISVYGEAETEQILIHNNLKTKISARVNTLKITAEELTTQNEEFEKGLIENSLFVNLTGGAENNNSFAAGHFYIQDIASQIAALTLAPLPGADVLDACAAPGGKSFLLAQLMKNKGKITSCDIYEHKLKLINSGAKRLGIEIIDAKLCDASEFMPKFENRFDFVLADVPCSGLGIIRKKPDIRYKNSEEIQGLPKLQLDILNNLSSYVKPGGALLYSTCTILPRENGDIVSEFLKNNEQFAEEKEYYDIPCLKNDYGITLLPHISGTDGFYMCKLRRRK